MEQDRWPRGEPAEQVLHQSGERPNQAVGPGTSQSAEASPSLSLVEPCPSPTGEPVSDRPVEPVLHQSGERRHQPAGSGPSQSAEAGPSQSLVEQTVEPVPDGIAETVFHQAVEQRPRQSLQPHSRSSSVELVRRQPVEPDGVVPSTSGFVSPFRISPPPKAPGSEKRRTTGRRGRATLLTSSPYKNQLTEEVENRRRKEEEKQMKGMKIKKTAASGGKTKGKGKAKVSAPAIQSTNLEDDETECLFCGELFSETRDEDWIQCTSCSKWAHDDCAGIDPDDDHFVCDLCEAGS